MANLYALIVGINKYSSPVSPLEGCVNDAQMFADYLQSNIDATRLKLNIVTLFDENATRDNIINAFTTHLGQAKAGDTAIFFFAGHGGQEEAHPFFFNVEPDRKLETILCVDSRHNGVRDIADKELRRMIHDLAGDNPDLSPHIVIIQDNCHSGSATRGEEEVQTEYKSRSFDITSSARSWDEFTFARDLPASRDPEPAAPQTVAEMFPQGRHVQIAACSADEKAWETVHKSPDGTSFRGGIFTRRLLEALNESKGNISYYDLQSRIRGRIGGTTRATQTPNMYVFGPTDMAYRSFAYGDVKAKEATANVLYNEEIGWHIDKGAFHNIPSQPGLPPSSVLVTDPNGNTYTAQTTTVEAGRSRIAFAGPAPDTDSSALTANVQGLFIPGLPVFFTPEANASSGFAQLLSQPGKEEKAIIDNLVIAPNESSALYTVSVDEDGFKISNAGDTRPVVKIVEGTGIESARSILTYLGQITRWRAALMLNNPFTKLLPPTGPVEISFFCEQGANIVPLPVVNNTVDIDPNFNIIRIRLQNISGESWPGYVPTTYFTGVLQLEDTFGIGINAIAGNVEKLAAGQELYLTFESGSERLPLGLPPHIIEQKLPYYELYLKVLISTTYFDTNSLYEPNLPAPRRNRTLKGEEEAAGRGFGSAPAPSPVSDWMTYTVKVRMKNNYLF